MPATAVAYKMRNRCLLMSILALASSAMLATSTFAAEAGATEHEGVSLKPQMLVQFGGFGITNSMLVTWLVAAGIIIFSQIAIRNPKPIPAGFKIFGNGWLRVCTIFLKTSSAVTSCKRDFGFLPRFSFLFCS